MLAQIWEHGYSLSCMKLDKSQGKELIIYKMMNNDESMQLPLKPFSKTNSEYQIQSSLC